MRGRFRRDQFVTGYRPSPAITIRNAIDEEEAILAARLINKRTRRENAAKRKLRRPISLPKLKFMED